MVKPYLDIYKVWSGVAKMYEGLCTLSSSLTIWVVFPSLHENTWEYSEYRERAKWLFFQVITTTLIAQMKAAKLNEV